jgi:putative ABC transport system permease protein
MVFWKIGWREIRKRPGRSLLTVLSIVIGVAAVVAVTMATSSTQRAFDQMFQSVAGRTSLEVTSASGSNFDENVEALISGIPGVAAVAPVIQQPTVMWFHKRQARLLSLGMDPVRDKAVHDYDLVDGHSLDDAKGVMLDAAFAKNFGVTSGDKVKILTRQGLVEARIAGLFTTRGAAATGQGPIMLMQLRAAQSVYKMRGQINLVQIVLDPAADESEIQTRIARKLPTGLRVHPPAARSAMAEETALSTRQGMSLARAFALMVAAFIITNTFLINVTQRRRQIGILRAIGATRKQVATMLYCEALLMGCLGTILGWLVGVVGACFLTRAMGTLYETTLPSIQPTPFSILLAVTFGMGISLIGAILPARRACQLSPVEAMRQVLPEEIEGVSSWLTVLGSGLVVICGSVLASCILGWLPMLHSVWSAVMLLTGLVLLMPTVVGPLSYLVTAALQPLLGVEARLARRQLMRHRARTTLTIGVLFVAISTGTGLASSIIDNVQDVRDWYKKSIVADFFVRAMAPDMATGKAADLPDEVDAKIRAIKGIKSIETARFLSAQAAGEPVIVVVTDFSGDRELAFDLVVGNARGLREDLRNGKVVIGSVLAERTGLKAGESIMLETESGAQSLPIAAIANEYFAGGLTMYMHQDVARKLLGLAGVDAYIINADPRQMTHVYQELRKVCDEYGLLLQTFSEIQQHIDGMMAGVVAGLWSLATLGFVIAAFGVANTLTMNVLEQTHELGLLRIVAMTRWQVRKTILVQALLLGILSLVPGAVAGIAIARLINMTTQPVIGHAVKFILHPLLFAAALATGLAIVLIAAWIPANRAARLDLLRTIQLQ